MKKCIQIFIFLLSCSVGFAQEKNEKDYKKWGIGIQVNQIRRISQLDNFLIGINTSDGSTNDKSYSAGITVSYFKKQNFALRMRTDFTKTKTEFNTKDPASSSTGNVNLNQTNYELALGGIWVYKKEKISFGAGFEIPLGIYGDFTALTNNEAYSGGVLIGTGKSKFLIPGGNSFGIGTFGNFNLCIYKNVSAGFQLSSAWLYYKIGGNTSEELWTYDASGNQTSYQSITRNTESKQFSVVPPIASISVTLSF